MKKVGIDIQSTIGRTTGLGVYTRHLTESLLQSGKERYEFQFYKRESESDFNTLSRWLWENVQLPSKVSKTKIDLLHIPAFAPPFLNSTRVLITVHDIIGMIFPNQLRLPSRWYWGQWLPTAIKRADFMIADSQSTKHDLIEHLKIPEKNIRVIYPSGHEDFHSNLDSKFHDQIKARLGIYDKYFLFVGTIEPRKNLRRVIEAFTEFLEEAEREPRYQLVVVGLKDFARGKLFKSIAHDARTKIDEIIFTGYVSHEELNQLYCGAEALVYPSLYEGFGIPILEAMASGIPVITARRTSMPEVAGEAALYVDAESSDSIAEGILKLSREPALRASLIANGRNQLKKFSWKKTAEETIQVYDEMLR